MHLLRLTAWWMVKFARYEESGDRRDLAGVSFMIH